MRGVFGPLVLGGDVNSIVRMGEHEASPIRWLYRLTGVLIGRNVCVGFVYRVASGKPPSSVDNVLPSTVGSPQ